MMKVKVTVLQVTAARVQHNATVLQGRRLAVEGEQVGPTNFICLSISVSICVSGLVVQSVERWTCESSHSNAVSTQCNRSTGEEIGSRRREGGSCKLYLSVYQCVYLCMV